MASRWENLPTFVRQELTSYGRPGVERYRDLAWELGKAIGGSKQSFSTAEDNFRVKAWLRQLPIANDERVCIWWPWDLIETKWKAVVEIWDELFYPSSDDAFIWPGDRSWVLCYDHFELLRYGRIKIAI